MEPKRITFPLPMIISPRALIWGIHLAIFAFAGFSAFLLRFGFDLESKYWPMIGVALPVWVITKTAVFRLMHLDRGWWAHTSTPDLVRVGIGNAAGSLAATVLIVLVAPPGFPRSIYILDLLLATQLTAASRLAVRIAQEFGFQFRQNASRRRVFIYGAGAAGAMLLRELRSNARLHYDVRGFIDDDPAKRGMRVQTVPILGAGSELKALAFRYGIDEVLIALRSATGPAITGIFQHCHDAGVTCKRIPSMHELLGNAASAMPIRDVDIEDLLGRSPVRLETEAIRTKIQDEVVLVTGAAGSIGSELCRQIARFRPLTLVACDIAETGLFHLEQEILQRFPGLPLRVEVANVQNPRRLADLFETYKPSVVYHAAAYKHVPLMESHIFEAVENNILGTYNVALAAARHRVRDFVMISSDKAVRPVNVMGLTKRVAELIVNAMQNGTTKFVSVRFGNVLGSNGSVVPIFKKQIAAGGPVTVTHPDMQRYFMTIPEAVQLVLQASTMGRGGETFVLDMGKPVKIADLAHELILLSGLRPGEDIKIEFTGVRPGERLYEELSAYNENTLPTYHEKIKIFGGRPAPANTLARVAALRDLCGLRDTGTLLRELRTLVPEYKPSVHVQAPLPAEEPVRNGAFKKGMLVA